MGPKKSGKKGKKSGKKKGKGGDSDMTFAEILLAYKITTKEQEVDELRFEVKKMEHRNENLALRNEHLLDEQASLTAQCIDKAREWRQSTDKPEALGHDSVVLILLDMWKHRDNEETELSAIHEAIIAAEVETNRMQVDVNEWRDYSGYGKAAQDTQIDLLEQEKFDNVQTFEEKKVHLANDLENTRFTVLHKAEETIEREKVKAAEKAMSVLQLGGRVELEDSRFLRAELNIHREEHKKLQQEINELENKNLEILTFLFDCKVEDIRFSKSIFNTLFKETEMLDEDENYIMQTDIDEFKYFDEESEELDEEAEEREADEQSLPDMENEESESETETPVLAISRPMSGKMQSIQNKLLDVARKVDVAVTTKLPSEADEETDLKGLDGLEPDEKFVMETVPEYGRNDPFMDYVTVGPIEEKLLAITGKKLPLIKRTKAELEAIGISIDDADTQGFFHWPENLNSSKLAPIKAPPPVEKLNFSSKLSHRSGMNKQHDLSPVDSLPSQASYRQRPSTLRTRSMMGTPLSPGSAMSKLPPSRTPIAAGLGSAKPEKTVDFE